MVNPIGKESALVREALRAAQRVAAERTAPAAPLEPGLRPERTGAAQGPEFAHSLEQGLAAIDAQVQAAETAPIDLLTGKVSDFHELAVQLKSAELSFKFAMEIRNKLVDAYREIMRMSV